MTTIFTDQNKPENIRLVCAFRQSYYKAKKALELQIYLTVALTVGFSTAKLILTLKGIDIGAYAVLYTALVFIVDYFILQPYISKRRTDGAKLQEQFDCTVFQLPHDKVASGKFVDNESTSDLEEEYVKRKKGDLENCRDWYAEEYTVLPMPEAVLACQKTSLVYDVALRNRFKFLVVRNTFFLGLLITLLGLIEDFSFYSFLLYVIAPLLPAIVLAKKLHAEHEKSIKTSADLKSQIDDLQAKHISITQSDLRSIQTKIFNNRKDSALIPEKLYMKLRKKLEDRMHSHAAKATAHLNR